MGDGDSRCRFNASRCTSGGLVVCCWFGGLAFWYIFQRAILDISRALRASRETSGLGAPELKSNKLDVKYTTDVYSRFMSFGAWKSLMYSSIRCSMSCGTMLGICPTEGAPISLCAFCGFPWVTSESGDICCKLLGIGDRCICGC